MGDPDKKLVKMNMCIAVANDDFVIDNDDHSLIPIFSSQTKKAVMMTINAMLVSMTSVPIVTKKMKKKVTIEFIADKDQTL